MFKHTNVNLKLTVTDPTLFINLTSGEVYEVITDEDGSCFLKGYYLCESDELVSIITLGEYEEPGFRVEVVKNPDIIQLTRQELITIMEDAFIDGWKTQDHDWSGPEDFLRLHREYDESSETTVAIDDLKAGV